MEYLDGERTFKTTDKGMNFLRIHNKVQGLTLLIAYDLENATLHRFEGFWKTIHPRWDEELEF